jgi:hypothetical protein
MKYIIVDNNDGPLDEGEDIYFSHFQPESEIEQWTSLIEKAGRFTYGEADVICGKIKWTRIMSEDEAVMRHLMNE